MNRHKRPTGIIQLDACLNGGLPIGRLIHIYGSSSVGKSSLVYKILSNYDEYSCLINTDKSFDRHYAEEIGVKLHNLFIADMYSSLNVFNFLKTIICDGVFRYIIIDSIAGLPVKDIYGYITKELPAILKELEKHDTILIFTNQVRYKGRQKKAAHGAIINAMSSVVLEVESKHKVKGGYEATINVIKNKYGMPLGKINFKLGGSNV